MRSPISKKTLGIFIRDRRFELGFSQEELADRADLHRTYISDLERGARNPTFDSLDRIAGALEITVGGMFQEAERGLDGANEFDDLVQILLVEDDLRDAELALRAFRKARVKNRVQVARDGAEALDFVFASGAYSSRPGHRMPDLILLDLDLPKVSGIEVLRRVKTSEQTRHIAVVVLTTSTHHREIAECRRLGAEFYIEKPVGFRDFSDIARKIPLDWALIKPLSRDS